MLIQRITTDMLRNQPDQTVRLINLLIDEVNSLKEKVERL